MRSAGNFSPEWGYLAPAPSFVRTARIVVVATAIGATAGAGVMLSLMDHPATEAGTTAVAAHAIVTSAQAATAPLAGASAVETPASVSAPVTVQVQAPGQVQIPAQLPTPVKPQPVIATQSPQLPAPQLPAPQVAAPQFPAMSNQPASPNTTSAAPAPQSVPSVAALTEGTPATDAAPTETPEQAIVAPADAKKPAAKHTGPGYPANAKNKPTQGIGTVLRQLFTAHASTSYYPNR